MSDFYIDHGAFLVRLFHSQELPGFVKSAEYSADSSVSNLPTSSFADPDHRRFPLHTPADVYVSTAYYFGKTGGESENVVARLKRAAAVFGIESDAESARELALEYHAAAKAKTASAPTNYESWAIETDRCSVTGTGAKPLERFADSFLTKCAGYAFDDREEIASEILLAARSIGADVPSSIKKYAAEGEFDSRIFSAALEQRASILNQRDKLAFLGEIGELAAMKAPTNDEMRKAACFLDTFDRQYGLDRHYGRGVIDPHAAVWSRVETSAAPATVKIGSVEHELDKVAAKLPEVFEYATGKVMDLLDNGVLDTALLAGLSDKQADVINGLL